MPTSPNSYMHGKEKFAARPMETKDNLHFGSKQTANQRVKQTMVTGAAPTPNSRQRMFSPQGSGVKIAKS